MTDLYTVTLPLSDWRAIAQVLGDLPTRANVWPLLQRIAEQVAPPPTHTTDAS